MRNTANRVCAPIISGWLNQAAGSFRTDIDVKMLILTDDARRTREELNVGKVFRVKGLEFRV